MGDWLAWSPLVNGDVHQIYLSVNSEWGKLTKIWMID